MNKKTSEENLSVANKQQENSEMWTVSCQWTVKEWQVINSKNDKMTGASTNPKNFDLNKNLNMNLIHIETWNLELRHEIETRTWNSKLKFEIENQN